MAEWLSWAKQPFVAAADDPAPSSSSSSEDPRDAHRSSKEEKEEVKEPLPPPSAATGGSDDASEWDLLAHSSAPSTPPLPPSVQSSWSSRLPSLALPALSLPSFLSASSASSASTSSSPASDLPPPAYSPPSISSSPTTNSLPSSQPVPPPSDVSYLRSLLSRWSFSSSSSSSPPPTSGVTPSGLHWQKVEGVNGFALSPSDETKPSDHRIPDTELARVQDMCRQLQQLAPPLPPTAPSPTSPSSSSPPSTTPAPVRNDSSLPASISPSLELDELWTLVDPARDKELAAQYNIEEGYVVVRHEDSVDGLALYLASVLHSHPEACKLGGAELRALLEKTLRPVEGRQGWLSGYVLYGYYAYLVYSWGSTAWWLYRKPWLISMASAGAVQAATWLLVLFV